MKVRSRVEFEEAGGAARGNGATPAVPAKAAVPVKPAPESRSRGTGAPSESGNREARDRHLARLISGVAGGDAHALRELHELTVGRVYGIALRIVRTKEAAEEVAIDAFLQVWRTASTYDRLRGGPLAWLLTIARSRALDYLRRAEPAEAHPDPTVLDPAEALGRGDDPQDLLLAVEGQAELMRALEQLSALQRQLIALAFFRGLTHQEIAAHARLPLGSVKTYIRRALAQLRAQLGTLH